MWPVRVLHVSDLHAGTEEEPAVEGGTARSRRSGCDPELVVASGDLTHRNTPDQHEHAAGVLRVDSSGRSS